MLIICHGHPSDGEIVSPRSIDLLEKLTVPQILKMVPHLMAPKGSFPWGLTSSAMWHCVSQDGGTTSFRNVGKHATTRRYIPERQNLQQNRYGNLKFRSISFHKSPPRIIPRATLIQPKLYQPIYLRASLAHSPETRHPPQQETRQMYSSKNKPHTEVPRDQAQHRWQEQGVSTYWKILTLLQHCLHEKIEISIYIWGFTIL